MFNTIKSGVAVDFPMFTGSTILSASAITGADASNITTDVFGTNYMIRNNNFDYRVPFEALIEPEAHLANVPFLDIFITSLHGKLIY